MIIKLLEHRFLVLFCLLLTQVSWANKESIEADRNQCSSLNYLEFATHVNASDLDPTSKVSAIEAIWSSLENHVPFHEFTTSVPQELISVHGAYSTSCIRSCKTENLNAIYESFIADEIAKQSKEDTQFKSSADLVVQKIISAITSKYASSGLFDAPNLHKAYSPMFGIFRKFESHEPGQINGEFQRNPLYFVDFLLNFALKTRECIPAQDETYEIIQKERGERVPCFKGPRSKQKGISCYRVESLIDHSLTSWFQPFKETTVTDSPYTNNAKALGVPIATGISGCTNVYLWTLLDLDLNMSPSELRTYIAMVWSALCLDGGHSLQEVLSASKIVANMVSQKGSRLGYHSSMIASLDEMTRNLSINGEDSKTFGRLADVFFEPMKNEVLGFNHILEVSRNRLIEYSRTHCQN